jgi:hypothetical protein
MTVLSEGSQLSGTARNALANAHKLTLRLATQLGLNVTTITDPVLSEEACYNLVGFPVVLGTKRVFWHDVIAQQIPPDLTLSPYSPS